MLADLWTPITPDKIWKGRTGRGVRVAVVDSGVDAAHPDLVDKVKASVEAYPEGGKVNFRPSTSGDQAGHGTACAGIITSVAPDVELYSIKVLGANAAGSGEMFLAGLDYAIKQKMQVINLSLGTTKPDYFGPLHDLIDRAYHAGCIVVAAPTTCRNRAPFDLLVLARLVIKREGGDPFNFGYRYGEVIELFAPSYRSEPPASAAAIVN